MHDTKVLYLFTSLALAKASSFMHVLNYELQGAAAWFFLLRYYGIFLLWHFLKVNNGAQHAVY